MTAPYNDKGSGIFFGLRRLIVRCNKWVLNGHKRSNRSPLITWIVAFFVLFPKPGQTDPAPVIEIGRFSAEAEKTTVPHGWEPLHFKKILKHTEYQVITDEGITVIAAISKASASGLIRRMGVDLREYPILAWRWKVANLISKSDPTSQQGDDYPARIYITFEYDPNRVGLLKKARYKTGRLLFGDIPIAAINYIWGTNTPQGTILDNAYTDFVKMIVVESGSKKVGQWVEEERSLYEDYKKAFGEEPPRVNGVAIMTDTDNTQETATAYYGDIFFKKRTQKGEKR